MKEIVSIFEQEQVFVELLDVMELVLSLKGLHLYRICLEECMTFATFWCI